MSIEFTSREGTKSIRAAEYVRMSKDTQEFSIPYQREAIRRYADEHGFTIVRSYADEARSGLTLDGRAALARLLSDVQSNRDFDAILVYDVSRWGRFQDIDEAGYYEFLCRKSGVAIHYCAEQFENVPSPLTILMKSLKRFVAADYSRSLSLRIGLAMRHAVMRGYFPGGTPGYGLRRMLVGPNGTPKGILKRGEWKATRAERVVLAPGPDHEVATVRRIFDLFVNQRLMRTEIAAQLNSEGVPYQFGRAWQDQDIHRILRSERYAGVIVFGQEVSKLGAGHPDNRPHPAPPHTWVRGDAGCGEIVSKEIATVARNAPKGCRYRDGEALLKPLRHLLSEYGYLSHRLIVTSPIAPAISTLRLQFGSLREAYQQIGYTKKRPIYNTQLNRRIRAIRKKVFGRIVEAAHQAGVLNWSNSRWWHAYLNDGRYVKPAFARFQPLGHKQRPRWICTYNNQDVRCVTIVVRMDQSNKAPLDYFCIPGGIVGSSVLTISAHAGMFEQYRFKTLDTAIDRALRGPEAG